MRQQLPALHNRIQELATDVGRLNRYIDPESSGYWILERVRGDVESITLMLEPSAAELAAWYAPGDPDAVDEAIRIVERRALRLRNQLGWPA